MVREANSKMVAKRQKEYRANRQLACENGERRVSAYVSTRTELALHRLANRYVVTKRKIFEELLIREEDKVLKGLNIDSPQGRKYLDEPG
jgi:hypothetical protein